MMAVLLLGAVGPPPLLAGAPRAKETEVYWLAAKEESDRLNQHVKGMTAASWRSREIADLCESAAMSLRGLDKTRVDPVVIDYVSDATVYLETLAMRLRAGGMRSYLELLLRLADLIPKAIQQPAIGALGSKEEQETAEDARRLRDREREAIVAMRRKYDLELAPW
jgi:hypothetical protein